MIYVPNLRFPEFEGEWESTQLKDIAIKVSKKNTDNKIDVVFSNSATQGIVLQNEYFDKSIANKENLNGYYIVDTNDFVYNPRLSSNAEVGAMSVNHTKLTGLVSPLYMVFRLSSNNVENSFLEYIFKSKVWHNHMRSVANQGARDDRMNVKDEDFFTLTLIIPHKEEQTKIARLLQLIDDRISTQSQIIEELKLLKSGICMQIFNNQKYIESVKLGDLCSITTGKLDANAMVSNGLYKFFTCAEIAYQIDNYAFDTEALLISGNGANVGYIHYYSGKFNAYQRTYVLDKFKCNILYVKYYLQTKLHKRIEQEKNTGNTPYIVLSVLSDMIINLTSTEEQAKIANFLSAIDEKLETEKQILKRYTEQKKYLLANMFI